MIFDYNAWLRLAIEIQMMDQGPKFQKYLDYGIDFPSIVYFILENSPNTVEPFKLTEGLPLLGSDEVDTEFLNDAAQSADAIGYFVISSSTVGVVENPTAETEALIKSGAPPESIPGLVDKAAIFCFYNGLGGILLVHSTLTADELDKVEWIVPEDTLLLGLDVSPISTPTIN